MRSGLTVASAALLLTLAAGQAYAAPTLPACDSPEARAGIDVALKKSHAPFTVTGLAGITTDKRSNNEVACLAIATLSNGSHRPIGYKFRIHGGKLQSWVGLFVMKPTR